MDAERATLMQPFLPKLQAAGCKAAIAIRATTPIAGFLDYETEMAKFVGKSTLPKIDIAAEDYACIFFTSG